MHAFNTKSIKAMFICLLASRLSIRIEEYGEVSSARNRL